MKHSYRELEEYLKWVAPSLLDIFYDINERPDPKPGDRFLYNISELNKSFIELEFVKVEYDSNFNNGIAFWYIFKNDNDEFRVWSINSVDDPSKLTYKERDAVFGFWKYCVPKK